MKTSATFISLLSFLTIVCVYSCKNDAKDQIVQVETIPGINLDFMDKTVKPGEDFFRYVNGKWLDNNKIPDDRSRWGSFDELAKNTDNDALEILRAAISENKDLYKINVTSGSDQEKAVNLFKTIMDTVSRNEQGIKPLKPYLNKIASIKNISDLQNYLIEMSPIGGGGFFDFGVGPHTKNSNINAGYLEARGLGLPDRDYYVKNDADSKEKREKYVAHITRMLQFLGDTEAEAKAQANQILAFETRLAEPRMDKVDQRDARKRYNPRTINELQNMVPAINWGQYFKGIGVKQIDTVIVSDVKYMNALQNILAENDIENWKKYLRWDSFNSAASKLSTEINKANWDFYSKTLGGAKKQRPLDETALQILNSTIGEALGKLYVDEKFPPEAKTKAEKMINNVIKAYEIRINNLSWMTDDTKKKAVEKLLALKVKIGYPDKWKDYSKLQIKGVEEGGSYLENMNNAYTWNHNEDMEDLGNPVDKSSWALAPQVVNAYFHPLFNEIVFPAAILQPPFYNYQADDAVNYGGIGAVIGHEISHSFDDSGSRYDKNGNLNNWWTDTDLKQFETLGKELANQYSAIEVLPETFINGPFTLGENIGDLGGVTAAYKAMQLSFEENGRPENINGFTPEQRFFISWATVWRTKLRDDALKNRIKTDPHSPGMVRAVQPLLNIDAFYDAFSIKEGDKIFIKPENRVRIW
jgi:putative endopeptidase